MRIFTKIKWRRRIIFFSLFICSSCWVMAQQRIVTGTIISAENGEGLPGVNIIIKGSTDGTITDVNGKFSLSVPAANTVLIFSFVGYIQSEIEVGDKSVIDLEMIPDISTLQEVVVIGYGTQKKVDVTGSVSNISGKNLSKAATPALTQNLAGKLTGVIINQENGQPGFERTNIFIRGRSTLNNNSALILVDGIPRTWDRIDPNDIESITVLKDAASTAVYGARAANGVMLITTKRGNTGKAQLSYSGFVGQQSPTVVPEMMNAYEYAKFFNEALTNAGQDQRFSDDQVEAFRNGTSASTDWWSEVFKSNAFVHQHNLALSGGTDNVKYYISVGHLDQDGLSRNSGFQRDNISANIDTKVTKGLTVSTDISFRVEDKVRSSRNEDAIFQSVVFSQPTEIAHVPASIDPDGLGFNGFLGSPIGITDRSGTFNQKDNYLFSTLKVKYEFPMIKGLTAQGRFSFDKSFRNVKEFSHEYDFYINSDADNSWLLTPANLDETFLKSIKRDANEQTTQLSLSYNRNFDKHTLGVLFLYERSSNDLELTEASRKGFTSISIPQLFAGSTEFINNFGLATEGAREGYVGRITYNYDEKYYIQTNFRYDGSFNFPKEGRWGFFPSVSVGWRISEEDFFANSSLISNLKIRGSYGQVGNDRVAPFQFLNSYVSRGVNGYVLGDGTTIYRNGIRQDVLANPNITWETATETNLGLELGLFQNKITLELDYFNKRTEDILVRRNLSIPEEFGAQLPTENFGIVENKGIEAALLYTNDIGEFSYSIGGNITYARNTIIEQDEPEDVSEGRRRTGRSIGQFFGYVSQGLFQSQEEINGWADQGQVDNPSSIQPGDIKYLDVNGDNVINAEDIQPIGNSLIPEVIYGVNLGASYKGLALTLNFQGATSFDRPVRLQAPFQLDANALSILSDSWRPDNTGAEFPRLIAGGTPNNNLDSDYWLRKGDYFRLKNLQLSYNLPKKLLPANVIKDVGVYIAATNILTFTKNKFVDPETYSNQGRFLVFPPLKSVRLGLNLTF